MSNTTNKYGIKYLNLKKYLDNPIYLSKNINNKGGSNLLITGDSYYQRLTKVCQEDLDIDDTPTYLSGFDEKKTEQDMEKINRLLESQLNKAETIQKDINSANKKEYLYNLQQNSQIDNARLQQDLDDLENEADILNEQINNNINNDIENDIINDNIIKFGLSDRQEHVIRPDPIVRKPTRYSNIIKLNL